MSVRQYYLARAADAAALGEVIQDPFARRSLALTAETWRLLAALAEEHGFDDLPELCERLPGP